jgi:hypothetical protein
MKIKFVLESFKKIENDLGFSVQAVMSMVQNGIQSATQNKSGDCYEFKFLYPWEQDSKVKEMLKEFKDSVITNSKTYQFDDKTGVLLFHTIPSEEKEKKLKKIVDDIFNSEDINALLLIKHPDDFVAKLAGMKIKFFDKEEFTDVENMFKNEMTEMFDDE